MAVAAVVAVAGAVPLLVGSLWRTLRSRRAGSKDRGFYSWVSGLSSSSSLSPSSRRFTTRDSFARGNADYAIVDEDEGELLGEDSDEEAT